MASSKFLGGSPVSDASNPFANDGVGRQAGADSDILGTLNIEGHQSVAMSDLDDYGSSPVTSDSAMERPASPPIASGRM